MSKRLTHGDRRKRRAQIAAQSRAGATLAELVSSTGLVAGYIRKVLRDNGISVTDENHKRTEQLLELAAAGMPLEDLAAKFKKRPTTVMHICRKAGVRGLWNTRRSQTIICAMCGDTHTRVSKIRLRRVCAKRRCLAKSRTYPRSAEQRERDRKIVQYSVAGLTLQAIGTKFDLTRERVRQILDARGAVPHSRRGTPPTEDDPLANIRNWDGYGYYRRAGGI
jgi:uncharacterized protein (DUF433 family)